MTQKLYVCMFRSNDDSSPLSDVEFFNHPSQTHLRQSLFTQLHLNTKNIEHINFQLLQNITTGNMSTSTNCAAHKKIKNKAPYIILYYINFYFHYHSIWQYLNGNITSTTTSVSNAIWRRGLLDNYDYSLEWRHSCCCCF